MSGNGISWAICKSVPHSRQISMPAPHHSVFYRLDALPAAQPTASKHIIEQWKILSCSILHNAFKTFGVRKVFMSTRRRWHVCRRSYSTWACTNLVVVVDAWTAKNNNASGSPWNWWQGHKTACNSICCLIAFRKVKTFATQLLTWSLRPLIVRLLTAHAASFCVWNSPCTEPYSSLYHSDKYYHYRRAYKHAHTFQQPLFACVVNTVTIYSFLYNLPSTVDLQAKSRWQESRRMPPSAHTQMDEQPENITPPTPSTGWATA